MTGILLVLILFVFFPYVWDGTCLKFLGKVMVDRNMRLRLLGAQFAMIFGTLLVFWLFNGALTPLVGPTLRTVVVFAVSAAVVRFTVLTWWFGSAKAAVVAAIVPATILVVADEAGWFMKQLVG